MSFPSDTYSVTIPPPIVYTIAGSDSGGGAGIQADLHAIHALGCHGCSAITCLTAQNSVGVSKVHSPPVDFLKVQLETLYEDLPPRAIKIGMLGTKELAIEVGNFLKDIKEQNSSRNNSTLFCCRGSLKGSATERKTEEEEEDTFVVLDPVMISTSGHKLIQNDAKEAMIEHIFPYADLITPNKFEAEEILGRTLNSPSDVEKGAQDILKMGVKAVLIKGGHTLLESKDEISDRIVPPGVNETVGYAQDYFVSSGDDSNEKERICDGSRGVWLRSNRYDSKHTHGTGCTLSAAIASTMAIGHQQRALDTGVASSGASRAIQTIDACCIAKAYVTAGISLGVQLGKGAGPVTHTSFAHWHKYFPSVTLNPSIADSGARPFLRMRSATSFRKRDDSDYDDVPVLGTIMPIVNNIEWVERLCESKDVVTDVQLRIKGETDENKIYDIVMKCQEVCSNAGVRLWVNDFWRAAVKANCFGVHLGQEDLAKCIDDGEIEKIQGMALGISTHSYAELAAAFGVKPSYISFGPVFGTQSKNVAFNPQGLAAVEAWRKLIDSDIPFVAIGGIKDAETALKVRKAGADCVAVIEAVTKSEDAGAAIRLLHATMES